MPTFQVGVKRFLSAVALESIIDIEYINCERDFVLLFHDHFDTWTYHRVFCLGWQLAWAALLVPRQGGVRTFPCLAQVERLAERDPELPRHEAVEEEVDGAVDQGHQVHHFPQRGVALLKEVSSKNCRHQCDHTLHNLAWSLSPFLICTFSVKMLSLFQCGSGSLPTSGRPQTYLVVVTCLQLALYCSLTSSRYVVWCFHQNVNWCRYWYNLQKIGQKVPWYFWYFWEDEDDEDEVDLRHLGEDKEDEDDDQQPSRSVHPSLSVSNNLFVHFLQLTLFGTGGDNSSSKEVAIATKAHEMNIDQCVCIAVQSGRKCVQQRSIIHHIIMVQQTLVGTLQTIISNIENE